MFFKPANSDTENGIKKSPDKNYIKRKLEKTLFESYQNNMAIGVDYRPHLKTIFYTVLNFKT